MRLGVPSSFWAGLDSRLADVVALARSKLVAARVVFVDVDIPGLTELNNQVSFQVALHEPVADIPAYLSANGITNVTLQSSRHKSRVPTCRVRSRPSWLTCSVRPTRTP